MPGAPWNLPAVPHEETTTDAPAAQSFSTPPATGVDHSRGAGMISFEPGSSPTVRRILLGSQLRRMREARGITREDAGYLIRASESKISRMELGRVGFKERDVTDLLGMYGVEAQEERDALVTLAREANAPGWWHKHTDVLPDWFQTFVGLEEAASVIRVYEIQFVPGLLQTADYARAVIALGRQSASDEEIERRVSVRMTRQELLAKQDGPRLWAVVDEAALRRPIGGLAVIRAQIEQLIESTQDPRVTLQVLPFRSGGHAAEGGAFTILRFPEADLPDVVYLEQLTSAIYLDKREDAEKYSEVMERLSVESEPPERTAGILRSILAEMC
jgi:transcriptional regulator with XRE-family HTH domain